MDSWDIHSAETVSLHSLDASPNIPQENNAVSGSSLEHTVNEQCLNEIQVNSINIIIQILFNI